MTLDLPTISQITPRRALSIQFGEIVKFPKYTSHNGARLVQRGQTQIDWLTPFRLDEKDVVKSDQSDDELELKPQASNQLEDDFENELDISDDSDW